MQKLIRILTAFLTILSITDNPVLRAQERKFSNFSTGADIVSRYIWRGLNLGGNSPHIQPWIEYRFGGSGLAAGVWGSHSLGASSIGTEADLYVSYTPATAVTITVTDYFFPSDVPFASDRYFNYDRETTGHTFEGMICFNGTEKLPLTAAFAMNMYGADGVNENGNNMLAKYLEIGYSGNIGEITYLIFSGFALDNPDEEAGAIGWYGNSAGMINLGLGISKEIPISESISIPVRSSLIFNPEAENIYLVFSLNL